MKQVADQVRALKQNGKKIVLATGVFDLLHQEHIKFLQKAKSVGDVLVVGVECDARVKRLKGEGRPVERQEKRLSKISLLDDVDFAFILPDKFDSHEDHLNLLNAFLPDVLAVSSSTPFIENKKKLMASIGGELLVVHEHNPQVSTTQVINEIDNIAMPKKENQNGQS